MKAQLEIEFVTNGVSESAMREMKRQTRTGEEVGVVKSLGGVRSVATARQGSGRSAGGSARG